MPSQIYSDICSGVTDPCDLTNAEVCELRGCLSNREWEIFSVLRLACSSGGGSTPAVTEANVDTTIASTSTSGSTAAGLFEVSIANAGGADGLVEGVVFPVDAVVTYRGYFDEFSRVMSRIAAISYDATGTTFIVVTTP